MRIIIDTMQEELELQLDSYVKKWNGAKQGSELWLKEKKKTIGGSEIYNIIIGGEKDIIEKKVGLKSFTGSLATQWGNMFEPTIQQYVERIFGVVIKGTDIFINGDFEECSYSPDGLGVLTTTESITGSSVYLVDGKQVPANIVISNKVVSKTVLFEFKCPFSRQTKTNTTKPDYIAQVKYGLEVIKLASYGLLCEAEYRKCSLADLNWTMVYDNCTAPRVVMNHAPIALGIIALTARDEDAAKKLMESQFWVDNWKQEQERNHLVAGQTDKVVDLGLVTREYLSMVMNMVFVEKSLQFQCISHVCRPGHNLPEPANTTMDDLSVFSQDHPELVAFLPFKMFTIIYHHIQREVGFLDALKPQIKHVISIVNECNSVQDPAIRKQIFEKYYPADGPSGFSDDY